MPSLQKVIRYYDALLDANGDDSRAVGWRNDESQARKFFELTQIFAHETERFTVYDAGCGLGHLRDFLQKANPLARYYGCDVNPRMVERALGREPGLAIECRDVLLSPPRKKYDYVLASGTFNLRLNASKREWKAYVRGAAAALYAIARRGVAIGFLSTFARSQTQGEYHEDPADILRFVQRTLSPLAEIRHSSSPGHFAVFAYRSLPLRRISRLRAPSLNNRSTIDIRGTNSP